MAKYRILSWHDIPSQIRVEDDKGRINKQLPPRFQEAIDSAAMKAKTISDDAYMDGFSWSEEQELPGSAQEVAETLLEELINQHPEIDWQATAIQVKKSRENK
jgi:hypothetical protein